MMQEFTLYQAVLSLQVGSTPGADFTSNWWDKVFDSAASSLRVNANSEVGGRGYDWAGLGVWQCGEQGFFQQALGSGVDFTESLRMNCMGFYIKYLDS